MNHLIHDSIFDSAARTPEAEALAYGAARCTYRELAGQVEAAAALFAALRALDETGATTIAVTPVPELGLGEAINDRLRRAAAPR